jgi:hypothetical protein
VPAADLDTKPCAHGFIPTLNAGASWTVKKIIFVEGAIRRISEAAAIPSRTGILMSIRTISGFSSMTFSTVLGVTADLKGMPI